MDKTNFFSNKILILKHMKCKNSKEFNIGQKNSHACVLLSSGRLSVSGPKPRQFFNKHTALFGPNFFRPSVEIRTWTWLTANQRTTNWSALHPLWRNVRGLNVQRRSQTEEEAASRVPPWTSQTGRRCEPSAWRRGGKGPGTPSTWRTEQSTGMDHEGNTKEEKNGYVVIK